jgi:serine/threonine-protein kinase RsbW
MNDSVGDAITICVPAKAEHIAVFRAAVGVVASRLEFSLDDIDDLRILVDEAASVLMSSGATESLTCEIVTVEDSVQFRLKARLPDGQQPHGEGFAWSILNALAHEVKTEQEAGGEHVISVSRHRGPVLDSAF